MFPNRYRYDEDWGEKYEGISRLGLFLLDIRTGVVKEVPGISDKDTIGQPTFTPCSQGIVYTAWIGTCKKMGMIYCYQRPCEIRLVRMIDSIVTSDSSVPVRHIPITRGFSLARSPRFNIVSSVDSEHNTLVFLGSKETRDTHNSSSSLYSLDWEAFLELLNSASENQFTAVSDESLIEWASTLIRTIIGSDGFSTNSTVTIGGYPFPGLYCGGLPPRPFLDRSFLLLETQWRSQIVILCVNVETGDIYTLHNSENDSFYVSSPFQLSNVQFEKTPSSNTHSWLTSCGPSSSIVDIHSSYGVLVLTSTPSSSPLLIHMTSANLLSTLMGGNAPVETCQSNPFTYMSLMTSKAPAGISIDPLPSRDGITSFILHTPYDEMIEDDIESILLLPPPGESSDLPPLLVCPHGGPHSAFSTAYVPHYSDYLCLYGGYAVLLVNYRGSTGYGQKQLNSLPGKIGVVDVHDVYAATQAMISLSPPRVSARCAVFGGSHGGFLTAHMIGQYPDLYVAAALRNPVINIPAMFTTSDIPDWCVVEASGLGSYDFTRYQLPSEAQFQDMTVSSPIR